MFKKILNLSIKTLFLLTLAVLTYYLLILKPQIELKKEKLDAYKLLEDRKSILVENRLSIISLIKLDPLSPNFDDDKSELVNKILKTNKQGEELTGDFSNFRSRKLKSINTQMPELFEKTKQVYKKQGKLTEKVFATKSFEEGVAILKSSDSLAILVEQTNLILEYERMEKQLGIN